MKKMLIVLMLLGVMTLEAKPKYRIETWVYNNQRYYLPEKKVWFRTEHFILPIKVWESSSYPFQNKYQAEEIIQNWKDEYQSKINYKQSEFIYVK